MKKHTHLLTVSVCALLFGIVGGSIYAAAGNEHRTKSEYSTPSMAAPVSTQVDITPGGLQPDTVTMKIGQTLQINVRDGKTHSFSLGKGGEQHSHTGPFSSGDFSDGEAWQVSFQKPGTYQFHDHYRPELNLLVVAY